MPSYGLSSSSLGSLIEDYRPWPVSWEYTMTQMLGLVLTKYLACFLGILVSLRWRFPSDMCSISLAIQ